MNKEYQSRAFEICFSAVKRLFLARGHCVTFCCLSCRLAEILHSAAEGAAAPPRAGVPGQPAGRDHPRHRRQGEGVSPCRRLGARNEWKLVWVTVAGLDIIWSVCLQGVRGGWATGARSRDEEEKIQQQRQMCPPMRREDRKRSVPSFWSQVFFFNNIFLHFCTK